MWVLQGNFARSCPFWSPELDYNELRGHEACVVKGNATTRRTVALPTRLLLEGQIDWLGSMPCVYHCQAPIKRIHHLREIAPLQELVQSKSMNSNPGALQRRRMSTGLDRYTGCATNRHNIMLVETARRHSFCVTFYHQENTEDVATAGRRRTGTT